MSKHHDPKPVTALNVKNSVVKYKDPDTVNAADRIKPTFKDFNLYNLAIEDQQRKIIKTLL